MQLLYCIVGAVLPSLLRGSSQPSFHKKLFSVLPRIKTSLISLNVAVTLTATVWLFYGSPLREELESRLSDLKTRIMPAKIDTSDVVIVTIDERTIKAIGGDAAKDLD